MTNMLKIAFLFSGQGAQVAGMGKPIYDASPIFKQNLDKCQEILARSKDFDKPLLSVLWGDDKNLINETKYTQPAMVALEYGLYQLMLSVGVSPNAVLGHSVGEYVAAIVAGVMSLEDGLSVIAKRAALMQALPRNGAMLAIPSDKDKVTQVVSKYLDRLSIAAINAPNSIVVSGNIQAINEVAEVFENLGIEAVPLVVSHAFHSPLLEPMLDDLRTAFSAVKLSDPNIGLIANLTGAPATAGLMNTPDYWVKHTRNSVLFAQSIEFLLNDGYNCFVEMGPHPVLISLATQTVTAWSGKNPGKTQPLLTCVMNRNQDNLATLKEALAKLAAAGLDIKTTF